ncbi:MAG: hypothetical protein OEX12_01295 [Gammaproteobacteria bacterium]|nr:hypothetical protein [Gammaproteobacteria bacterium]
MYDLFEVDGLIIGKNKQGKRKPAELFCPRSMDDIQRGLEWANENNTGRLRVFSPNRKLDRPKSLFSRWSRDTEAIYDTAYIIADIEQMVGKRGRTYLRKYENNTEYIPHTKNCPVSHETITHVMQLWGMVANARKSKNFVGRDEVFGVKYLNMPNIYAAAAYRDNNPVGFSMYAISQANPHIAIQLISKALNYKEQLSGGNMTSAWMTYRDCRVLYYDYNVVHINAGSISSTDGGLEPFKRRLTDTTVTFSNWRAK